MPSSAPAAAFGGLLGQTVGLRATLLIGGLAMLPECLWVLFSPVRTLRQMPTPADNAPVASRLAKQAKGCSAVSSPFAAPGADAGLGRARHSGR